MESNMAAARALCRSRVSFSRFFRTENVGYFQKYDILERSFGRFSNRRCISKSAVVNNENADLEKNPFYEKYAAKIKVALNEKEEGRDPPTFEDKIKVDPKLTEETNRMKAIAREHQNKQKSSVSSKSGEGISSKFDNTSLDSILHMDRVNDLSSEQIEQLWKEYHKEKDSICACIPTEVYEKMQSLAKEYPMFIFPLPRESGYEFMFAEFNGDICLMTSLLQYQTLAENAPWVLAVRHFTELKESKGIVLMAGEVDTNQLSVIDAQWLGTQIQMYYASDNPTRLNLLRQFNKEPEKFDHMGVIEQLDSEIASGKIVNPVK